MKIRIGCSKIVLLSFLLVFSILWFRLAYYPFCKVNLIESDYGGVTINDKILAYEERIKTYGKTLFLTKGMSFKDIPYKDGRLNIYMGWDNCITISSDNLERVLHVERIYYYRNDNTDVKGKFEEFIILDSAPSEDSLYIGIGFADNKNNSITIYKQPSKLPYGDREFGFCVDITGLKFETGKNNCFDY